MTVDEAISILTGNCAGDDVDYIRCPFCKGQGDYDIIEYED